MAGVFERLATEWECFKARPHADLADGDRVDAFGVYSGTCRKTARQ